MDVPSQTSASGGGRSNVMAARLNMIASTFAALTIMVAGAMVR